MGKAATFRVSFVEMQKQVPKLLNWTLLFFYFSCFAWTHIEAVNIQISYSFYVPERFGEATVQSAGCCPHVPLPENNTEHLTLPTVFGIGVQKGGKKRALGIFNVIFVGTTTLFNHLMMHPQMYQGRKEMHYMDDVNNVTLSQYLERWAWNSKRPKRIVDDGHLIHLESIPPKTGKLFEITPSYMFVRILFERRLEKKAFRFLFRLAERKSLRPMQSLWSCYEILRNALFRDLNILLTDCVFH